MFERPPSSCSRRACILGDGALASSVDVDGDGEEPGKGGDEACGLLVVVDSKVDDEDGLEGEILEGYCLTSSLCL